MTNYSNYKRGDAIEEVLMRLSPREEKVIQMRLGLGRSKTKHTFKDIGQHFGVSGERARQIEIRGLRKLRHMEVYIELNDLEELKELKERELQVLGRSKVTPVGLIDVIETITKLTPALIAHLKFHKNDLNKIPWSVFEHLVAEFFASWNFTDVRLVGRNSVTSADIFAAYKVAPLGANIRYFIEVKRWKDKVGVDVIDHVYGAMLNEKPRFGWHAGMIVSLVGFKDFKKYTRQDVINMGIDLKDRDDLLMWLKEYRPNKQGLWLPNPSTLLE